MSSGRRTHNTPEPAAVSLLSEGEEDMPRILEEFEDEDPAGGQQEEEEEEEEEEDDDDEDEGDEGDMMSYFQDLPQLLVNEAGLPLADVLTDISASVAGIHEEFARLNKILTHLVKRRLV